MTSNLVAWLSAKETERSNKVREVETQRHNTVTEQETERHNRAMEELGYFEAHERQRANLSVEGIRRAELSETARHNFGSESLTAEGHNVALLGHQLNLQGVLANVGLGYSQLEEQARHHRFEESNAIATRRNDLSYKQKKAAAEAKQAEASLLQAQTGYENYLWTSQVKWPAEYEIEQGDLFRNWLVGRQGLVGAAGQIATMPK